MAHYLDTSAAVKLVVDEPGSRELLAWLRRHPRQIASSDLLRTELLRAIRRAAPDRMHQARMVLDRVLLLSMPPSVFEHAAQLEPVGLRSLDALHLAAALELGDELDGLLTYDERLAGAASALGVEVVAPT